MFGKEYANHLDILIQSFGQMNDQYQEKIKINQKSNTFIGTLKKMYVLVFGIPEIGFQIRSIYFKKIITSHVFNKNPKNILDAGSGIGAYSIWLAKNFNHAKITGGEIDKDKIISSEIIRKQLHLKNINFVYFDIMKHQRNPLYDLIICIDVLEHINCYEMVLKNFYDLLQNNGYLYIHVPQPKQKRVFSSFKTWHHQDHVREGIAKDTLENRLKKLGFWIISSQETSGFFGKITWEINHLALSRSFILAGIIFPILYILAMLDSIFKNKGGLGVAVLAKKQYGK